MEDIDFGPQKMPTSLPRILAQNKAVAQEMQTLGIRKFPRFHGNTIYVSMEEFMVIRDLCGDDDDISQYYEENCHVLGVAIEELRRFDNLPWHLKIC